MNKLFLFCVTCLVMIFFACQTEEPFAPVFSDSESTMLDQLFEEESCRSKDRESITVMTRNVYVGADVDLVLAAPPDSIPIVVGRVYQQLFETDFPGRAKSLAREIDHSRPHMIGLQEISLIRYDANGDAIGGAPPNATEVVFDYLEILMLALEARGLHYEVAGMVTNADVEVPMLVGVDVSTGVPVPVFHDVRLTDMDVILVHKKVEVLSAVFANFGAVLPAGPIIVPRGYVAIEAQVGDRVVRFINTHLEAFSPIIRQLQADELLLTFAGETLPTIMVGDFNTPAPLDLTYQSIVNAGYMDIWPENRRHNNPDGFTFGHDPDLRNKFADFYERIDIIFLRNFPNVKIWAKVVGDERGNKTDSGLWPSDHGGVVARLRIKENRHLALDTFKN